VLPLGEFAGIGTPDYKEAIHLDVRTNVSQSNPVILFDASRS